MQSKWHPGTWQDTCHKWSYKLQSPKAFVCLWVRDSRVAVQDLYLNDLLHLWLLYTVMLCLCPEAQLPVPSEQATASMWCGFPPEGQVMLSFAPCMLSSSLCCARRYLAENRWKSPHFTWNSKSESPWQNASNMLFFYSGNTSPTASPFSSLLPHPGANSGISAWCSLYARMLAPQELWAGWIRGPLELEGGHQYLSRE